MSPIAGRMSQLGRDGVGTKSVDLTVWNPGDSESNLGANEGTGEDFTLGVHL